MRPGESLIASFLIILCSPFPLPASLRRANAAEVGEQEESRICPRKRDFSSEIKISGTRFYRS